MLYCVNALHCGNTKCIRMQALRLRYESTYRQLAYYTFHLDADEKCIVHISYVLTYEESKEKNRK